LKHVLSIETSCDDTSVALLDEKGFVVCSLVASQDLVHKNFGGVVPEIASRNHSAQILPLVDQAIQKAPSGWDSILGIAVTNRPGLVGSLIVGLVTAKSLALFNKVPFLGVHHIEGHIMAPFLDDETYQGPKFFNEEFVALIVSGGHTQLYHVKGFGNYEVLGQTIDDAAGEAFDKFGKMMGLPYPGGVQVDQSALKGDPRRFSFPKPLLKEDNFNFSFSGLKSAASRLLEKMSPEEIKQAENDLCASYQASIVEVLSVKLEKAISMTGVKNFVVSGGVSANSGLRKSVEVLADKKNLNLALPPLRYCTDNAAMIGLVGLLRLQKGEESPQDLAPLPRAPL
jgi:N6-L-threonylcarbamoyladenine synthase